MLYEDLDQKPHLCSLVTAPGKLLFPTKKYLCFYFPMKTYVVGTFLVEEKKVP